MASFFLPLIRKNTFIIMRVITFYAMYIRNYHMRIIVSTKLDICIYMDYLYFIDPVS